MIDFSQITIEQIILSVDIITIIGFIGVFFVLFRDQIKGKDATIQSLEAKIDLLNLKISDLNAQSPDILVERLLIKKEGLEREITELNKDLENNTQQIAEKEQLAKEYADKLIHLKELLSEHTCPYCDAFMTVREHGVITASIGDKDYDADVEYVVYECGYSYDHTGDLSPCNNKKP